MYWSYVLYLTSLCLSFSGGKNMQVIFCMQLLDIIFFLMNLKAKKSFFLKKEMLTYHSRWSFCIYLSLFLSKVFCAEV